MATDPFLEIVKDVIEVLRDIIDIVINALEKFSGEQK